MARLPDLIEFARKHNLKICSIASLIEYRRKKTPLVERGAEVELPTKYGTFNLYVYRSLIDDFLHVALVMGEISEDPIMVRVHSECLTGDVFGSLKCDCGQQLDRALTMIAQEKRGILLYMRQEGRGIGLLNKIKAYQLQNQGLDTVEANEALGFAADLRDYGIGAQILADLGVKKIRLLTNNPRKIVGLEGYGMKIVERIPIKVDSNPLNRKYLDTKKTKLDHLI